VEIVVFVLIGRGERMAESDVPQVDISLLWKRFKKTGSKKLRHQLAEFYFPFVKKIAVRLAEKLAWQVQPDELSSFGIDGVYVAIDRFDLNRGVKFESFANSRVRGSMIDGLRRNDIIPRSVRITNDQMEKHRQRLQNHYKRRISDQEFIEITGMNEADFGMNKKRFVPITFSSLDSNIDTETNDPMKQDMNAVLIDKSIPSPDGTLCRKEFFNKLMSKQFSKLERQIVYLYYYSDLTMDRVASAVGLSESRVSQMHKTILGKLKEKVRRNPSYFDERVIPFVEDCNSTASAI
jgi:RNA polymerase sigma factor FliA